MSAHRVVIVGGGFGGLRCARSLRRAPVDVILVDRQNYHLFQPLLYQVATGELSPANIASPLRAILDSQKNCQVLLGEVTGFDVEHRKVWLRDGELPYDTLVVAAGARHSYFGHDEWEPYAPGLKTIEDATTIRRKIYFAFEAAERETDPDRRRQWLTFVIVGSGPTGVELAGALSEVAHHTLKNEFRHVDPQDARILLIEAADKPLSMYPEPLVNKARSALEKLHVTVMTGTMVTDIRGNEVHVKGPRGPETILSQTVIWAAGVAASPLGKQLAEATGASVDRAGRIVVEPDLSLPNHPEVFVIGDLANFSHQGERPLPGLAQVAMQGGDFVAGLIKERVAGRPTPQKFHYRDPGSLAVIGRFSAIALIGKRQLSGLTAWFVWLFVHLMSIAQFRNRLLVMVQWGWTFFTRDRSARLITGEKPSLLPESVIHPQPTANETANETAEETPKPLGQQPT